MIGIWSPNCGIDFSIGPPIVGSIFQLVPQLWYGFFHRSPNCGIDFFIGPPMVGSIFSSVRQRWKPLNGTKVKHGGNMSFVYLMSYPVLGMVKFASSIS